MLRQPSTLLAIGLLVVAFWMLLSHLHAWRVSKAERLSPEDLGFAWGQYLRRMQTSGMLVSLAVFIFFSQFLRNPLAALVFWLVVMLMVIYILLLAWRDLAATRHHFRELTHRNRSEQARLKEEIERARQQRGE